MSEKNEVAKKIRQTKLEIEQLENQFQSVINEGKNIVCPSYSKQNLNKDEKPLESPNKVQIIKSYEKHSTINTGTIPKNKTEIKPESPKKTKTYDVKEAREYMKRQKEKQSIKQKQTQDEKKIKAEIQKKKLQELNKKSRELLAKNVNAKRERSKSRDRSNFIRLDDSSNFPLRKENTVNRVNDASTFSQKNPNLLYPPNPNFHGSDLASKVPNPEKDPDKLVILARNYTRKSETYEPIQSHEGNAILSRQNKTNLDKKIQNKTLKGEHLQNSLDKNRYSKNNQIDLTNQNISLNKEKHSKTTDHFEFTPRVLFRSHEEDDVHSIHSAKSSIESVKNILEYKSTHSSKSNSNLAVKTPDLNDNKKIEEKTQDPKVVLNKKIPKPTNKFSVEIQTEILTKKHPEWLNEQPPQAYPFNFINTVKRKLQNATMQQTTTDVGVQSSVIEPACQNQILPVDQSLSPDSKKQSDLRSFISHKCLNLDPKTIEHLELVQRKNSSQVTKFRNLQTQTSTKITETESESDTSKNIPEISSESGTSLKKNAESVKKALMLNKNLAINTERIDNMKLVANNTITNKSISNISSTSNKSEMHSKSKHLKSQYNENLLSVDNKYDTDFDSDIDVSSESLDRSRRSIISYNKPGYNLVIINSPDIKSIISPKGIDSKNSISSVNTEMIISAENVSNAVELSHKNGAENTSSKNAKSESRSNSSISYNLHEADSDENIQKYEKNKSIETKENAEKLTSSKNSLVHTVTRPSSSIIENLSKSDVGLKSINIQRRSTSQSEKEKSDVSLQNINTQSGSTRQSEKYKPDVSLQNINRQRGSTSLNEKETSDILSLSYPSTSLVNVSKDADNQNDKNKKLLKNISVRSSKISAKGSKNESNQIHLKFEAEIHLLNDFNKSLERFSALEQALESLKTKNSITTSKILQNNDAQTSLTVGSKSSSKHTEDVIQTKDTQSQTSRINYSRGSFINTSIEDLDFMTNSALNFDNNSIISTGFELSNFNSINHNLSAKTDDHLSNFENVQSVNFAGMSINMFEQLIKDEDARLENLKTILKIREQALLDRTKGELAWLEIQRKHFKETGKLHEASVIKKKQRGILVNHQKEKHEMQRLKQMQKAASIERKIVLKEQRNLIRQQLSTDNMLTKMKVNTPREKRISGPLKVLQNHTESIRSETSISRKSSIDRDKDILSITSRHSVTSHSVTSHSVLSEISAMDIPFKNVEHQKYIKKTLLMRETALKKRRKAAEELLQWHKKLLEEEKRIAILESTASAIISQKPNTSTEKFDFKGNQLNQLWFNLTGSGAKQFADDKIYPMSQLALERFCKSAREYSQKTKTVLKKTSDANTRTDVSVSENIPSQKRSSETDYISDFDVESIASQDVVDQSIDILINNFNKIQDDISNLSIVQTQKSDENPADEILSESPNFDKTESEVEVSVIETNRTDNKDHAKISSKLKSGVSEAEARTSNLYASKEAIDKESQELKKLEIIKGDYKNSLENSKGEITSILTDQELEIGISSNSAKSKQPTEINSQKSVPSLEQDSFLNLNDSHILDVSSKDKPILSSSSSNKKYKSDYENLLNNNANSKQKDSVIISENLTKSKPSSENKDLGEFNLSEKLSLSLKDDSFVPLIDSQSIEDFEKSKSPIGNFNSQNSRSDILFIPSASVENTLSEDGTKLKSSLVHNLDSHISEISKLDNISKNLLPCEEIIAEVLNETRLEKSESKIVEDFSKFKHLVESEQTTSSKQLITEEKETIDDDISTIASDSSKEHNEKSHDISGIQIIEADVKEIKNDEQIRTVNPPIATETKESLNESQEILHILGESEVKTSSDEEMPDIQIKDSLKASKDILLKLNIVEEDDHATESNKSENNVSYKEDEQTKHSNKLNINQSEEDLLSQSILKLYHISKSHKSVEGISDETKFSEMDLLQEISLLEQSDTSNENEETDKDNISNKLLPFDFCTDLMEAKLDESFENQDKSHSEMELKIVNKNLSHKSEAKGSDESHNTYLPFKIDENNENQTFLNNLVASATEIDVQQNVHDESDDAKLALSDKSNESFVINDVNDDSNEKLEENLVISQKTVDEIQKDVDIEFTPRDKTDDYSSIMEDLEEESDTNKTTSHFSYGVLPRSEDKDSSDSCLPSKEESNSFEEKEHDSLSSANGGSSSEALNLEEQSLAPSEISLKDESKSKSSEGCSIKDISFTSKNKSFLNSKDVTIDVKKRVSEILADKNVSRGDKSPRLQDLYITTYDLISPPNSPEKDTSSPKEEPQIATSIFDSEAEEILRKQLAVEEEIKAITEQQQKEQLPHLYIREIPNKPPPPYTPPSSLAPIPVPTIIPTSDEIEDITMYSAKILHKAYLSNNLANVSISNNTLSLISKNISKDCYKFVFDLCKDIARQHYKQFEVENLPSWLRLTKKVELTLINPLDTEGLKFHMIKKLKEIFGYQEVSKRENAIIKWSRKKRDHVDEILVMECQQEEAQWINYQKDELLVKDQITNEILDSLLKDTTAALQKMFINRS